MPTYITPERYLEEERKTEARSEYYRGEVFPRKPTKFNHALVVANIIRALGEEPFKRDCLAVASSLRVAVSAAALYTYPDVTIICGEPQYLDDSREEVTNPKLIFEVSSDKFIHYRTLPSLAEYITVAQDAPPIVQCVLQSNHRWLLSEIQGMDQVLKLESLDLEVPLSLIYKNVKFDA